MTEPDTTRALIDRAVGAVLFNASNYPERVQSRILGQDTSPLREKVTDAVLAVLPEHSDSEWVRALIAEAREHYSGYAFELLAPTSWPVTMRQLADALETAVAMEAEWEYGIRWRPDGAIHWEWDLDELRDLTHAGTTTWRRRASGAAEEFTPPIPEENDRG